jgi:hypothetical protein
MMAYKFVKQTRRGLTLASSSFAKFGRHSQIGSVKFASPHLGLNIEAAPQGCWISNRGKTQGGRGWVATNSGRYGMAGLPGTASLEPR